MIAVRSGLAAMSTVYVFQFLHQVAHMDFDMDCKKQIKV